MLDKQDSIVIQSTGNGKGLCFQFPPVYQQKRQLYNNTYNKPNARSNYSGQWTRNQSGIHGLSSRVPARYISCFGPFIRLKIIFATPEWLFTKLNNTSKLSILEYGDQLCFIAIDEAHLIYEWNSFRPMYLKCQDIPSLFPSTPIMALSATVTPDIMAKLQSFLRNPIIEKGSVYHQNIFLEAIQCSFK